MLLPHAEATLLNRLLKNPLPYPNAVAIDSEFTVKTSFFNRWIHINVLIYTIA